MKIGLIDIDSKIPNVALMKISAYHKQLGDNVEFYTPFKQYDKVYASKVFKETKSLIGLPNGTIRGGSGFGLKNKLPKEIEHIYPDYSLYDCDYAMGYLTRGCINNCEFCIVRKKEGILHKHAELEEFWNGQKHLMLLDNSLTDYKYADLELQKIIDNKIKLNLCQGFNVRTIKPEIAELLSKIKLWKGKQWHIAWDNIKDEKRIFKGINILNDAGIKNYKIMCYVLIGFNTTLDQDLYRINILNDFGIDPFVMPYCKNEYTHHLARWVNHKAIFNSVSFKDYMERKTA